MSSEIVAARDEIARQFGPWTAHDIALAPGVSTMDKGLCQQWRVDLFNTLILQHCRQPYSEMRILDLACLEGLFAIEFARMGAETVGLEIREAHLAKAEFARSTLGLSNCRFVQGDVRAIPDELGRFDVILCAGILYHLDFPDCVKFLRQIAERSSGLILIDSHFAYRHSQAGLGDMTEWTLDNRTYWGRTFCEHAPHVTPEEKRAAHTWASIDNERSVWLTEGSAIAELKRCGFYLAGQDTEALADRPTLLFRRGRR